MANLRANNLTGTGGRNAIDGSVYFRGYIDGTNSDYLKTADLDDYDVGTGDFTFECWIKVAQNQGDYAGIFGMYDYDNAGMLFQINNTGVIRLVNPTQIAQTGSTVLWGPSGTMGSWQHIAVARSGSTLKAFINGISEISVSYTHGIDFANGGGAVIGVTDIVDHPGDLNIRGYVSNLRLIKGSALYTANFTPPTEKLTAVDGTVLLCCQDSDDPTQEATGKTITGYGNLAAFSSGDNLVTNGTFDSATTGWTSDGTMAIDSNRLKITNDAANYRSASQDITVVVGKSYRVSADCIAGTSNNSNFHVGNTGTSNAYASAVTSPVVVKPTTTTMRVTLNVGSNTPGHTALYDNVEAREVEPPKAPKVLPPVGVDEGVVFDGDTKVNTQNYMYFPTGDTSQRGRGRAVWFSGNSTVTPAADAVNNTIDYIQIQSGGTAIDFGDMPYRYRRNAGAAFSSSTRGINAGGFRPSGSPSRIDTIMYINIATTSNALDFGNLSQVASDLTGLSNETRGMWAGALLDGSWSNHIDYITIASTGNTADFGDLNEAYSTAAGCASPTRGLIGGGYNNTPATTTNKDFINYITIATTGNTTDFGNLTVGRRGPGASSSGTRAVWAFGASSPTEVNTIDYITIATTGDATDFGDYTILNSGGGGSSNGTRGVFGGGYGTSPHPKVNVINRVEIATTGNASDFGDLSITRANSACTSDSHGGLS